MKMHHPIDWFAVFDTVALLGCAGVVILFLTWMFLFGAFLFGKGGL